MRRTLVVCLCLVRCGGADVLHDTEEACGQPGALVVTELAVRGTPYVEIYNAGRHGIDLADAGVSVAGRGAPRRTALDGRIAAGRYLAVSVPAVPDDGGAVTVDCDTQVVDEVHYADAAATVVGLDGSAPPDATLNDDPARWCEQAGSAGGANEACAPQHCLEAEAPHPGELVVSEVLRDPAGADADAEWVELAVMTSHPLLLDGLAIDEVATSTRHFQLVAAPCAVADAGTYLVLPVGGTQLPRLTRGEGLFNDRATLTLRLGEVVLDSVSIDCGSNGSACARVDEAWCEAATPTPGAENRCGG